MRAIQHTTRLARVWCTSAARVAAQTQRHTLRALSTMGGAPPMGAPQGAEYVPQQPQQAAPPINDACVIDVDEKNFQEMVVQASIDDGPVIVDFHAAWCEPCKIMTPKLERAVLEAGGTLRLAKCDIDANPALKQAFQVESIPHVAVVYNGKMLHSWTGAKDDDEIDELITQYEAAAGKSNPRRQLASAQKSLNKGEVLEAKAMYTMIANNTETVEWTTQARGGLALCAVAEGNMDEANELLAALDRKSEDPVIQLAISKVDLMVEAHQLPAITQLQEAVQGDSAQFEDVQGLALRQFAEGKHEDSIKTALMLVKKAKWRDEGKAVVLRLIDALEPGPIKSEGRKRLGAALFN